MARTYTVLHTFDYPDGAYPIASLLLVSNTLYGTTFLGGLGGGTVFKVNIDGSDFQKLHNFDQKPPLLNQSNGRFPFAGGLVISGRTLFGTTVGNSSGDNGTIFAMDIDGSGYTNLHSFSQMSGSGTNADGAHPYDALIFSGGRLYGTTPMGGNSGNGTIFSLNNDGSDFLTLYNFDGAGDGVQPLGGLAIQSNVLYGTTIGGGNVNGTVFSINTDGNSFKTIYAFSFASNSYSPLGYTNSDGFWPRATLAISEGTLYGAAPNGGLYGFGTLFKVGIDGANFSVIETLGSYAMTSNGRFPNGDLTLVNDTLYATAAGGTSANNGSIFTVRKDGTHFGTLYAFPKSFDLPRSAPFFRTTNSYPSQESISRSEAIQFDCGLLLMQFEIQQR